MAESESSRTRCRAGDEPPLHVHRDHDEGFYVIEGELTLYLPGGDERVLSSGDFVLAPRAVPHTYVAGADGCAGDGDVLARGLRGCRRAHVGARGRAGPTRSRPAAPTPEQAARLAAVADEHGIGIRGPPGTRP